MLSNFLPKTLKILGVYLASLLPVSLLFMFGAKTPLDQGGFGGWFTEVTLCGLLAFIIAITLTVIRKKAKESYSRFPLIFIWLQVLFFGGPPLVLFLSGLFIK